ncbi:hypothetical protein BS47DRAFT_1360883 [Hydnum rufescens UP504]|uniref:Uncharacterized protein n=1 Tax=Hydnum rufescens UP504 TaxID=1448309 RepID=A0A9P6B0V7_9AGAM|nr:hypothetical protein BS47DRAFT_1360883 [Hydnum rufescens UP504]
MGVLTAVLKRGSVTGHKHPTTGQNTVPGDYFGNSRSLGSQYYRHPEATKKALRTGHVGSGGSVWGPDGSPVTLEDRDGTGRQIHAPDPLRHSGLLKITVVAHSHHNGDKKQWSLSVGQKAQPLDRDIATSSPRRRWVEDMNELPKDTTGEFSKHVSTVKAAEPGTEQILGSRDATPMSPSSGFTAPQGVRQQQDIYSPVQPDYLGNKIPVTISKGHRPYGVKSGRQNPGA